MMHREHSALDSRLRENDDKGKGALLMTLAALLLTPPSLAFATPQLDPRLCQALVKHVPSADVAYRAGVDVHGKAVAPADLPDSPQIRLPEVVTIPLTADLATLLNLPAAKMPFKTGADTAVALGSLTLEGDRVLYNGQPLTGDQQDNLSVLCLQPDGRALPPPQDLRQPAKSEK